MNSSFIRHFRFKDGGKNLYRWNWIPPSTETKFSALSMNPLTLNNLKLNNFFPLAFNLLPFTFYLSLFTFHILLLNYFFYLTQSRQERKENHIKSICYSFCCHCWKLNATGFKLFTYYFPLSPLNSILSPSTFHPREIRCAVASPISRGKPSTFTLPPSTFLPPPSTFNLQPST